MQLTFTLEEVFSGPTADRVWRVLDRGCKHEVTRIALEHELEADA